MARYSDFDDLERRQLAEQLDANPLFGAMLDEIEQQAISRLINARSGDLARAQMEVQAAQRIRAELKGLLFEEPKRRGGVI